MQPNTNFYRTLVSALSLQSDPHEYNNSTVLDLIDQVNTNHNEYLHTVDRLSQLIRSPPQLQPQIRDLSGTSIPQRETPVTPSDASMNIQNGQNAARVSLNSFANSIESQIQTLFGQQVPVDIRFVTTSLSPSTPTQNTDEYIQRYTRRHVFAESLSGDDDSNSDTDENPNICPITRSPFRNGDILLEICACGHKFSQAALMNWLRTHNTCPVCRVSIRR